MAESAGITSPPELPSPRVIDRHRTIVASHAELEAMVWNDPPPNARSDTEDLSPDKTEGLLGTRSLKEPIR